MKDIVKNQRNLITNNYLSSTCNHTICLDISELGRQNGYLFAGVDVASRAVIMHQYSQEPLQVQDVIETMEIAFKHRDFLPKIQVVHTDRGSIFRNVPYQNFIEKLGIQISRGSAKGHDNQVIERTFRTIKGFMRPLLDTKWKPAERKGKYKKKVVDQAYDPINLIKVEPKRMQEVVLQAINMYNNKPHTAIHRMTPMSMEDALLRHYNVKKQRKIKTGEVLVIPKLTKNIKNNDAQKVKEDQVQAIVNYAAQLNILPDLQTFPLLLAFVEAKMEELKEYLLTNSERQKDEIIQKSEERYQDLYDVNLELKKAVYNIEKEAEMQKIARESSEQRRQKRKNAIKAPLRETIDEQEFFQILEIVKRESFVGARKKCAMIILYLTGIRVSNLLVFSVRHTKELLEKGETTIPLIKSGPKRFLIKLSDKGRQLIKRYNQLFYTLMINKSQEMPFFTTQVCYSKPIDRTSLEKELNTILTKASDIFKKHIRTHSFRATLITNYLQRTPIDVVKDVIGHRDIKTTALYKRSKLHPDQFKHVLKELDKTMFQGIQAV